MPLISGGGGSFNGGTITEPLVIVTTDGNVIPLSIQASWNAQNQDFFQVVNSDTGTRMLAVDVSGNVVASQHTSEASPNLKSDGGQVVGALPGVEGRGAIGSRTLGFYDQAAVAQAAAIADASGGAIIDAVARTALNSLLAAMRAVGMIAT